MSEHALNVIEDRLVAVLSAWPGLAGKSVIVSESDDVAFEDEDVVAVSTRSHDFDVADENWQAFHTAEIDVSAVRRAAPGVWISRANRNTLANVIAAVAADRTLGIGLHEIEEADVANEEPTGRDVDVASVRFTVRWFSPRGDHFTIS